MLISQSQTIANWFERKSGSSTNLVLKMIDFLIIIIVIIIIIIINENS